MATFLQKLSMATNAFIKTWANPDAAASEMTRNRVDYYNQAYAYYRNTMFSRRGGRSDVWQRYISERELYKHTRLIYNPVPEIVDFYVDNLWQTSFNPKFPNLATALVDETDEKITAVVAQVDQWCNWLTEQQKVKRYAAMTGGVLIEGHLDYNRQKITQKTIWGSYVTDLVLNDAGDVQSYTLEYDAYDAGEKQTYKYKKLATKELTKYFRNDIPFIPEGKLSAVEPNPLGFCFAVWLKHSDDGAAAVNNYDKVDEVNSLASHLHDNIHKEIESGKIIGIDDPSTITVLTGGTQNKDGSIAENDPRLDRLLLAGKGAVSVHDLSGLLKLAEAHPYLKDLLLSFGNDYPELEYRQIIKESGQMSGIALERLLTPAQNRLDRAAASYDQQLIKLRQMQIAAGGYALKNEWSETTAQQKLFAPFGLDSYESGELNFSLKRSVLIELTEDERADLFGKKLDNANKATGILPLRERIAALGYDDAKVVEIIAQLAKEDPVIRAAYGMTEPKQLGE